MLWSHTLAVGMLSEYLSFHLDAGNAQEMPLAFLGTNPSPFHLPALFSHSTGMTPLPDNKHIWKWEIKAPSKSGSMTSLWITLLGTEITVLWNKNDFLKPIIKYSVRTLLSDYTFIFFFDCVFLFSVEFMLNIYCVEKNQE